MKRFLLWFAITAFAFLLGTVTALTWMYLSMPPIAKLEEPEAVKLSKDGLYFVDAEEYVVLSTAIINLYDKCNSKQIVIVGKTEPFVPDEYSAHQGSFPVEAREAIAKYESSNRESYYLTTAFKLPAKYHLISQEELDTYFGFKDENSKSWKGFYEDYPNTCGLIAISRVGFNRDKTNAFLYISSSCGGLCGTGYFVYLKKEKDAWKVYKKEMLWVS